MQLHLATTRNFNGNELACYVDEKPTDEYDFWATREQIGRFLGYSKPRDAIRMIHKRNKERLNKFSTIVKMPNPSRVEQNEPPLKNMQAITVYNFKGLLEICRFSNQPTANQVIDILWDIANEIRKKGYFVLPGQALGLDVLSEENKLLRQQVDLLQTQNNSLKKFIQDNSSFTLLGQAITPAKGIFSFAEGAKLFAQHGIKIGQNRLVQRARDKKLIAKRKGRQHNQPTQMAIEKGYFVMVVPFGSKGTPYLTMKGMQFFANELAHEQYPLLALIADCEALNE